MSRPLILDANSLIVRNIMASALQDLKHGGKLTGGVYGSLSMLKLIVATPAWRVGRVYAFFDNGVPAFRRKLLPKYKSARKERREMLSEEEKEQAFAQIDDCFDLWPLLGITCLCFADREADDGVAAAARLLREEHPVVVSSDRDLYQCVRFGSDVFDLGTKVLVSADNFEEVTGVPVSMYVLYRALVGDSSDSIAGVKGCGPKRAAQLLRDLVSSDFPAISRPPGEQCEVLALYLATLPKRRMFEDAALLSIPWLQRVCAAVDLGISWGGTRGLSEALAVPAKFDLKGFLRAVRALGMNSVLGDPSGWTSAFQAAFERSSSESSDRPGLSGQER